MPQYVVLQCVLDTKIMGGAFKNLSQLENMINAQAKKGYRLHTITTASVSGKTIREGRIQATMVFEKL